MDVVNSAWSAASHGHQSWIQGQQQAQYEWSLSSLPSPKSALGDAHGGQVLAPWPIPTDRQPPNPHSSATSLTGVVDLSLPQGSAAASPTRGSPGLAGGQFAGGFDRPVDLVPLSTAWPQSTGDGVTEVPSGLVPSADASLFAATTVETSRSEAASSIPSPGTDHGFSIVLSNPPRSSATSASSPPARELGRKDRGLHALLHHDHAVLQDLVQIFFSEIHPYWPILHVPTFEIGIASEPLLGSMVMLASWVVGRQEHLELAPLVFDEVTGATGPVSALPFRSLSAGCG